MGAVDQKAAVYVSLALTKRGKRTLQFAGDLAGLLGRDLVALIKPSEARDRFAVEFGMSVSHENDLVRKTIVDLTNIDPKRLSIESSVIELPEGSIRVTSDSKNWCPNPSEITFFSASEVGLFERGRGPIYVTVGDKWTHPTAIREAVELAKTLGVGVMLYHSTWKQNGIDSDNPRDHVSGNALKVLSSAVQIARDAGVHVEIALEHAPTIADGVLRHAIENDASAIVMTKSSRARRGSYVDQVVTHSPVPVYVAPLSNGGMNVDDLPPAMDNLPFFAKQSRPEPPKHIAYMIMAGVFLMYLLEIVSKLCVGAYLNSPVITGDGWHNVADIFEVVIVVVTIYLANLPKSQHYPKGWKNLEHIFGVFVGLSLCGAGLYVAYTSLTSIFSKHQALHIGAEYFPWAVGVMSFATAMSFVVGKMEIIYGEKYGYPSIVADGEETISDGRIAVAAVAGICGEYLFGLPQIEYFLGAIISFFILHAGVRIIIKSVKALLGHSMGDKKEKEVRELVMNTRGVLEIVRLQTSIYGSSVDVDLHLMSKVLRSHHLHEALESRVVEYCVNNGFISAECHVEFLEPVRPNEDQVERIAFAAIADPNDPSLAIVAPSLSVATHIVGADDEKYSSRRSFIDPMPKDLEFYLSDKHMKRLYVYGSVLPSDAKAAEDAGVPITPVSTYCLETLGA